MFQADNLELASVYEALSAGMYDSPPSIKDAEYFDSKRAERAKQFETEVISRRIVNLLSEDPKKRLHKTTKSLMF